MRAALALLAVLWAAAPAQAQENILGPCRDGYRWLATAVGGQPVAAYATCREARPLIILACGTGLPELRIAPAVGTVLPEPQDRATASLSVDGAEGLALRLSGFRPLDGSGPVLRVQLTDAAIQAMARGFNARLDARGTIVDMHLGASGDVLNLVARRC